MTSRQTIRLRQDGYGVTYADPLDPDFSVRFKTASAGKNLNGIATTNFVTEVIVNDNVPVEIRGQGATDAVSVRVRVSGSLESNDRKIEILKSIAAQLQVWADENILTGFPPSTEPVNPVTE